MAIDNFKTKGYASLKGIILNARNVEEEYALVKQLADELETEIIIQIPRDPVVQECENQGMSVLEGQPESDYAKVINALAKRISQ